MRTSVTFEQITSDLLADPVQVADILSQPVPKKQKGKKGDGKGKYKSKQKGTFLVQQPTVQQWMQIQPSLHHTTRQHQLQPRTKTLQLTNATMPSCPPSSSTDLSAIQSVRPQQGQRQKPCKIQQPQQRPQRPRQRQTLGTAQHGDSSTSDS